MMRWMWGTILKVVNIQHDMNDTNVVLIGIIKKDIIQYFLFA